MRIPTTAYCTHRSSSERSACSVLIGCWSGAAVVAGYDFSTRPVEFTIVVECYSGRSVNKDTDATWRCICTDCLGYHHLQVRGQHSKTAIEHTLALLFYGYKREEREREREINHHKIQEIESKRRGRRRRRRRNKRRNKRRRSEKRKEKEKMYTTKNQSYSCATLYAYNTVKQKTRLVLCIFTCSLTIFLHDQHLFQPT
jgi:hypothetical protein